VPEVHSVQYLLMVNVIAFTTCLGEEPSSAISDVALLGAFSTQGEIDFTSSSITDENLWFQQNDNDLLVKLLGTNGQIDVASGSTGAQSAFNVGGLKLDN
jgi:hypothetical protein